MPGSAVLTIVVSSVCMKNPAATSQSVIVIRRSCALLVERLRCCGGRVPPMIDDLLKVEGGWLAQSLSW